MQETIRLMTEIEPQYWRTSTLALAIELKLGAPR